MKSTEFTYIHIIGYAAGTFYMLTRNERSVGRHPKYVRRIRKNFQFYSVLLLFFNQRLRHVYNTNMYGEAGL